MNGSLRGRAIGFGLCASHHNRQRAMAALQAVVDAGADVYPVLSHNAQTVSTRHGTPDDWYAEAKRIAGRPPLTTLVEVEPVGPLRMFDAMVVLPCTGSTLAKLANAITESPIHMAVKATLRNGRPVVLAITSNDALGLNARNLGTLLAARNFYFVPFGQDDPEAKPTSLEARFELVVPTLEAALAGRQLQPLLVGPVADRH